MDDRLGAGRFPATSLQSAAARGRDRMNRAKPTAVRRPSAAAKPSGARLLRAASGNRGRLALGSRRPRESLGELGQL